MKSSYLRPQTSFTDLELNVYKNIIYFYLSISPQPSVINVEQAGLHSYLMLWENIAELNNQDISVASNNAILLYVKLLSCIVSTRLAFMLVSEEGVAWASIG